MGREKRKSKVAEDIIKLQNDDGTWGNSFHSLGIPRRKHFLTTEQALRRLKVLGFTMEDRNKDCTEWISSILQELGVRNKDMFKTDDEQE